MKLKLCCLKRLLKQHWRGTAMTVVVLLVLGVCGVLGDIRLAKEAQISLAQIELAALEKLSDISIEIPAGEPAMPEASQEDIPDELLKLLWEKLEQNNLPEAAAVLNQNQTQFQSLFYDRMGGQPFLYDGEGVTNQLEGYGIVFKRATTVFFGTFANERPEGDVLALQAFELTAPRYDYAIGKWVHGKMNGFGTIGYHYYEGIEGEESKEVQKQGTFQDDRMDGEIMYMSTNSEELTTTWHLTVSQGTVQMEERWMYDEELRTYSLPSDSDEHHAYVIEEKDLDKMLWRNMVTWTEE